MLTNEDLMKISGLFDIKFEAQNKMIDDKLSQQKKELREERRETKAELKQDIQDVRVELSDTKTELKQDICVLRNDVQRIDDKTDKISLILENDVMPRLVNIESCYVDTFERYKNGIIEMETIKTDVEILKNVAMEHSEKFKKIQ